MDFNEATTLGLFSDVSQNTLTPSLPKRHFKINQPSNKNSFTPKYDIEETSKNYLISIDLPGVEEKAISITVENNLLKIEGKRDTSKPNESKVHKRERTFGSFESLFTLTDEIDLKNIRAELINGVLRLVLPFKFEKSKDILNIPVNSIYTQDLKDRKKAV